MGQQQQQTPEQMAAALQQQQQAMQQQQMIAAMTMMQQQMASMTPQQMQQQQQQMTAMQSMMLGGQSGLMGGLSGAGASTPKHAIDSMQSPAAKAMTPNGEVPGLTDRRYEGKVVMMAKSREFGFLGCPPEIEHHLNNKDIFINRLCWLFEAR